MGKNGIYLNGEYIPMLDPKLTEARFNASLKKMLGKELTDEEWDALEAAPFDGDIEIKRPKGA